MLSCGLKLDGEVVRIADFRNTISVVVLDPRDKVYPTDTAEEQVRSGLTMLAVLDRKLTFSTVVTLAGAHTTVVTARMCPLDARAPRLLLLLLLLCRLRHIRTIKVLYRVLND